MALGRRSAPRPPTGGPRQVQASPLAPRRFPRAAAPRRAGRCSPRALSSRRRSSRPTTGTSLSSPRPTPKVSGGPLPPSEGLGPARGLRAALAPAAEAPAFSPARRQGAGREAAPWRCVRGRAGGLLGALT